MIKMIRLAICFVFIIQVYCQTVLVQYYSDANCTQETYAVNWTMTTTACVQPIAPEAISGSNFQCYNQSLCFMFYEESGTCDGTGRMSSISNECAPAHSNSTDLYSKIISGTDECDPTPEDYSCYAAYDDEDEEEPIMVPRDWTIVIFLVIVLICEIIAVIRAFILYKQGPPTSISSDQLTMEDLTVEGLDVSDPFTLASDEDLTVQ